jgi:hypothetical protein
MRGSQSQVEWQDATLSAVYGTTRSLASSVGKQSDCLHAGPERGRGLPWGKDVL